MAQTGSINLRIGFDGPSMESARADIERHFLKYGDEPAPHLKADAQKPKGGTIAGGSKSGPNVINVTIIHEAPSQDEIARRVRAILDSRRPPPGAGASAYRNRF